MADKLLFISQGLRSLTDEEIVRTRKQILAEAEKSKYEEYIPTNKLITITKEI